MKHIQQTVFPEQHQTQGYMQQPEVSGYTQRPRLPFYPQHSVYPQQYQESVYLQQPQIPGYDPLQHQPHGYVAQPKLFDPRQHQSPDYTQQSQIPGYPPQHQASGYIQHPTPSYTPAVPGVNRQSNPATSGQPLNTGFQTQIQTLSGVYGTAPGASEKKVSSSLPQLHGVSRNLKIVWDQWRSQQGVHSMKVANNREELCFKGSQLDALRYRPLYTVTLNSNVAYLYI